MCGEKKIARFLTLTCCCYLYTHVCLVVSGKENIHLSLLSIEKYLCWFFYVFFFHFTWSSHHQKKVLMFTYIIRRFLCHITSTETADTKTWYDFVSDYLNDVYVGPLMNYSSSKGLSFFGASFDGNELRNILADVFLWWIWRSFWKQS